MSLNKIYMKPTFSTPVTTLDCDDIPLQVLWWLSIKDDTVLRKYNPRRVQIPRFIQNVVFKKDTKYYKVQEYDKGWRVTTEINRFSRLLTPGVDSKRREGDDSVYMCHVDFRTTSQRGLSLFTMKILQVMNLRHDTLGGP